MLQLFLYWTKIFIEKTKKAKIGQKLWTSGTQLIIWSTVINQGIVETKAIFFLECEIFQQTAQILKYFSAEV